MVHTRSICGKKSIPTPDALVISEATFRALTLTSRAVFRMLEADGEARIVPDEELPSLPGKKQESAGSGGPGKREENRGHPQSGGLK